ncbi:MAG TPA: glycosyltransferase family 4 protein [Longimicrobiaceae bacterium]|nr:glycosyltransferase family 4 protein [Longimicrobiaceae bacterium]
MRIAIVNWSRRELGGAESYLRTVIPELSRLGHEVALWTELDQPVERARIPLPNGTHEWCAAEIGHERAVCALRDWEPDLLYVHITTGPAVEEAVLDIAPAVLFAHAYYGTCVSGTKTFKHPQAVPCGRRFGWPCLLHYYPRRCGGLSPLTMIREYRRNVGRSDLLSAYRAIVTNSDHMREEYVRHGIDPASVHVVPLPIPSPPEARADGSGTDRHSGPVGSPARVAGSWNLLFAGRMDLLKGGRTLIEALPMVLASLGGRLNVTFAGDGPDRAGWERLAALARDRAGDDLAIRFVGWKSGEEMERLWAETDLLVVPSLWPEPFGLVGPEAGLRGVPAAAFAVGGIPDWLTDGVNGHLAPAEPPTAAGLADAIVRCLRDPDTYGVLRRGAVHMARRFNRDVHLRALTKIFEDAVQDPRPGRLSPGTAS